MDTKLSTKDKGRPLINSNIFFIFKTLTVLGNNTRIVHRATRQAAETVTRSISCSLQLRLASNESKKGNGHSDISVIFQENAAFIHVLIYQD